MDGRRERWTSKLSCTAPAWRRAASSRAGQAVAVTVAAAIVLWMLAPTFAAQNMDDDALNAYNPSAWRTLVWACIAGAAFFFLTTGGPGGGAGCTDGTGGAGTSAGTNISSLDN